MASWKEREVKSRRHEGVTWLFRENLFLISYMRFSRSLLHFFFLLPVSRQRKVETAINFCPKKPAKVYGKKKCCRCLGLWKERKEKDTRDPETKSATGRRLSRHKRIKELISCVVKVTASQDIGWHLTAGGLSSSWLSNPLLEEEDECQQTIHWPDVCWRRGWWSVVNLSFSFRTPSTSSYLLVGVNEREDRRLPTVETRTLFF